jgi:hypothetical protein
MNRENTSDGRTPVGPAFSFLGRLAAVAGVVVSGVAGTAVAGEFLLNPAQPSMDRLMYPYAFDGGSRPLAYTFGSFDPRFDTRDGQVLLGWDTAALVPTNLPPSRYLLKRAKVTLTVASESTFQYDPTHDVVWTYATNHPAYVPDTDLGRPVELVGTGFRNGYSAATFLERAAGTNSIFGPLGPITGTNISIGTRNAFAAVFDEHGALIDLSNNVGQTNPAFTGEIFEFKPWALGRTEAVTPGELVPAGTAMTFEIDLTDTLIAGYIQTALADGRLRFTVTSLHPAAQSGFGGAGAYPLWYLRESLLGDPAKLEIEGTWVDSTDSDGDGLPDDWERFHFASLDKGASEDSDGDGDSNLREWQTGSAPNNAASVLRITGYRRGTGGAVFRFPMAPGRRYDVEESTDLVTWGPGFGRMTYPEAGIAEWIEEDPRTGPVEPSVRFHRVISRE